MAVAVSFAFYPQFVRFNHGVALLMSLCRGRGIKANLSLLGGHEAFRSWLRSEGGEVTCFSVVTKHDYELCRPFMRLARAEGRVVVLGGVYAGHGAVRDDEADFICRGEGEALPDFLESGDSSLFDRRMIAPDLNALPLPDYQAFAGERFERGLPFLEGKLVVPYYSSRGCPFSCRFCLNVIHASPVRIRTRVDDDLRELTARYSPDLFFLGDALTPYYSSRWRESWGSFRHPFFAYIRADIRPDELSWLIDRGMTCCAFGVESGDERHRMNDLGKVVTDEDVFRTVGALHRHDIDFVTFFMHGTPGESFAARLKTKKMMDAVGGVKFLFKYEPLEGLKWESRRPL